MEQYGQLQETKQELAVKKLHESLDAGRDSEEDLWNAILLFAHYPFRTSSGLHFTYRFKSGRGGVFTDELFVDRKEESKSITKSSILIAYRRVLAMAQVQAEEAMEEEKDTGYTGYMPPLVSGPKKIGQIFGISYIYPVFYCLGLITVPEKVRLKMTEE